MQVDTLTRLTFAEEKLSDAWDDALELIQANEEETGVGSGGEFKPDRARYEQFCKAGLLRVFTARWEGKLVGYCLHFVTPHLHYPSLLTAQQDVLYMQPAFRGRGVFRFMVWFDEALKAEGVQAVIRAVSERLDYSRLLEHMGYKPLERTFWRRF